MSPRRPSKPNRNAPRGAAPPNASVATPPTAARADALLAAAEDDGTLSLAAQSVLQVPDLGAQIQAGLGIAVEDVHASEVVLVTMMPDDSGSIRFAGNAQAIRDGHNLVLDTLVGTQQRDEILAHTRYLNGHVLFPYLQLDDALRLDRHNYHPTLGTPLYDQTVVLLGTVLAKTQELLDAGVPARTLTLILTDGQDAHSTRYRAADVRAIVDDMLRAEIHIVAAMGIDDGSTDFRAVFREMGIRDEWILVPGSRPEEIRHAFQVFSRSAMAASQEAHFGGGTGLGGFGA